MLAAPGDRAIDAVLLASIVVPLIALAVVCWIFWKAAQRDRRASAHVEPGRASRTDDGGGPLLR